ncbi:hypothetical protein E0485_20210 [Paenibacillus albiflavus]|uniref:DUF5316 domain-containing protein n=1 Tax=Paenibacillus albiflavus TaxID=2545760 RepID=A0A4R4E404_9BACL|nr:DUF5316 family protein [Paenibacillus albiflavus]TCZ74304.1 hypothetical protein E0485_20210 [Paenibacillus albiflavus]
MKMKMKTLLYSTITCLVIAVAAFFISDLRLSLQICLSIGGILLALSMVFSGALGSGERIRANFNTSTVEDNETRFKWSLYLLIMAAPFLTVGFIIFMVVKQLN